MPEKPIYSQRLVVKYTRGAKEETFDMVVDEMPLTIFLNDLELATLVCSPYAFEELAVGFLVSEGLLHSTDEIREMYCREEQGVMWVETSSEVPQLDNFLRRNFASCCGKGRPSLYFVNDRDQLHPIESEVQYTARQLMDLSSRLERESEVFKLTGGVHSAALADTDSFFISYSDIGRHNALDRVLGYSFIHQVDPRNKAVLLSGRIASEMLIKTVRIGAPLIISRSAPTGLAVDLAEENGVTLVGFVRGERLTVYSHPERVIF
ncbi:MAG: formate dehydrogenase accessory sulfurtransferase FdhD [Candidatus Saccharibacteria bacterium]